MDLYCGAGTFTLPLARRCGYVSAVESYGPAVRDLRRNLERAGIGNADPIGGADFVQKLSAQPARAIAYVSCDPATLARDLARFRAEGAFRPLSVTPVDLFPQTFHVETVVLMSRVEGK